MIAIPNIDNFQKLGPKWRYNVPNLGIYEEIFVIMQYSCLD